MVDLLFGGRLGRMYHRPCSLKGRSGMSDGSMESWFDLGNLEDRHSDRGDLRFGPASDGPELHPSGEMQEHTFVNINDQTSIST